jgi:hypothetical protein
MPTFTQTLIPSSTLTPSRSPTQPPTSTLDPCDAISLGSFSISGEYAEWVVTNYSGLAITVDEIWIDWPTSNGDFERVKLDVNSIWYGEEEDPPKQITSWSSGPGARKVNNGSSSVLGFRFEEEAAPFGYDLEVTFTNGCVISP